MGRVLRRPEWNMLLQQINYHNAECQTGEGPLELVGSHHKWSVQDILDAEHALQEACDPPPTFGISLDKWTRRAISELSDAITSCQCADTTWCTPERKEEEAARDGTVYMNLPNYSSGGGPVLPRSIRVFTEYLNGFRNNYNIVGGSLRCVVEYRDYYGNLLAEYPVLDGIVFPCNEPLEGLPAYIDVVAYDPNVPTFTFGCPAYYSSGGCVEDCS